MMTVLLLAAVINLSLLLLYAYVISRIKRLVINFIVFWSICLVPHLTVIRIAVSIIQGVLRGCSCLWEDFLFYWGTPVFHFFSFLLVKWCLLPLLPGTFNALHVFWFSHDLIFLLLLLFLFSCLSLLALHLFQFQIPFLFLFVYIYSFLSIRLQSNTILKRWCEK